MQAKLRQLKTSALLAIKAAKDKLELETLEYKLLGRKNGELTNILKSLKDTAVEARKEMGALANETKQIIEAEFARRQNEFNSVQWSGLATSESLDISQPALPPQERGHFHPITLVQKDLEDLFTSMGFMVLDGPELESDYYNFTALNIPATHPARDMHDTFYVKDHPNWVMRTHTSPVQVRALQKYGVPIRAVVPGKCFRNEATDPRHEHTLYHMEGLVVDEHITFSHLKGVLSAVTEQLYGKNAKLRLLPKFYPFVEPGVRGEVTCFLCAGKGCRVCKQSGWLEIFGAGLVHPKVLLEAGADPKKYQGFAFGLGLSRLVMLKYGIEDVRLLESGDMRFLEQF